MSDGNIDDAHHPQPKNTSDNNDNNNYVVGLANPVDVNMALAYAFGNNNYDDILINVSKTLHEHHDRLNSNKGTATSTADQVKDLIPRVDELYRAIFHNEEGDSLSKVIGRVQAQFENLNGRFTAFVRGHDERERIVRELQNDVKEIRRYINEDERIQIFDHYQQDLKTVTDRLEALELDADPTRRETEQELGHLRDAMNNDRAQFLALKQAVESDREHSTTAFTTLADLLQKVSVLLAKGSGRQSDMHRYLTELGNIVTTLQQKTDASTNTQANFESHLTKLEETNRIHASRMETLENLATSFPDTVRTQWDSSMQTLRRELMEQIERKSQRCEDDHRTLEASFAGLEERLIEKLRQQDSRPLECRQMFHELKESMLEQLGQRDQRRSRDGEDLEALFAQLEQRQDHLYQNLTADQEFLRRLINGLRQQVREQLTEQLQRIESIASTARDLWTAAFNQLVQEMATKLEQQSNGLSEVRASMAAAMHELQKEVHQQLRQQNQRTLAGQETLASMRQDLGAWAEQERQRNEEAMTLAFRDFEQRLTTQTGGMATDKSIDDVLRRLQQQEDLSSTLRKHLKKVMDATNGTIPSGLSPRMPELVQQIGVPRGPEERRSSPPTRDLAAINHGEVPRRKRRRQMEPPIVGYRRCRHRLKGGDCVELQPRALGEKEEEMRWYCGRHAEARFWPGGADVVTGRVRKPKRRDSVEADLYDSRW
ncbi:MAG: hypothetical protein L6R40_008003 [Gallowayella cf. fulva]|nr:MAG: hypothetical protein L6R40_008003 [Xanthomendoza cf. fulva]